MKRFTLLFAIVFLLGIVMLTGCGRIADPFETEPSPTGPYPTDPFPVIPDTTPSTEPDEPVPDVVEIVDIVDQTKNGDICTADALEGFYSDDTYDYYFPSIKSGYIIVHYSDGTTQPVREALGDERVTIDDLDRFGIGYYKEERHMSPMYVMQVIDRTITEGIPTDTALEKFWEDEFAEYYFPSIKSMYVIVLCSNDNIYTITEALEIGVISINQLAQYNIEFSTVEKSLSPTDMVVDSIVNWAEEYGIETPDAEEIFYEDDDYRYIFPSLMSDYVIVKYTAGWQENIKAALTSKRATVADLDRFGIQYYKESKDDSEKSALVNIVDLTSVTECEYSPAGQKFYEDDTYEYFFMNCIKDLVVAVYEDGSTEPVWMALEAGRATIADLDRFGIQYYKEPKEKLSNPDIKEIYDRVARGEIENDFGDGMYDDTFDTFYEDDSYEYVLCDTPYEAAVVVVYTDGTMESISDALYAGRIVIDDLENHCIPFSAYAKNISTVSLINHEIGGDMVFMWDSAITPHDLFDHSVEITESLRGNMSCFSNYKLFERFADTVEGNITYYHDLFDTWEREETFDTLVSKYNKEWFDNNALILIHYSQGHYIGNREITVTINKNAAADGGDILTVNMDTLNFGPDLGVDWFVFVEVAKEDIIDCSEYSIMINEVQSLEG